MVVHSHYPLGEPRVEREARAALDAGYDVSVICLGSRGEPSGETLEGVAVTRLPIAHVRGAPPSHVAFEYVAFSIMAAAAVLRILRTRNIDVVYVHAPPDFLIVTALIPRLLRKRVVLDIHDLSPHMFDARFGGGGLASLVQRCLRVVEVGASAIADRVVTVHGQYRDELVSDGVPERKISVVMNSPDPAVLDRARIAPRSSSSAFTLAYHGTVNHWYGVDLIIEAMARLEQRIPDVRALILGEGDALLPVERLAEAYGLAERVEFSRRYLPQSEALRRVAGAGCGVIPNRSSRLNRFALSSKLLEYVSLEIPVVVANLETLAAHFDSDEVTFFEPGDADSLAEAIAWVAEHPAEAREKARRARLRAEAYSWSESRARLLEALSGRRLSA
jgi:glycosyltransferase involved in cell wall biosynthesis